MRPILFSLLALTVALLPALSTTASPRAPKAPPAPPVPCASPCPDVMPRPVMEALPGVVRVRVREAITAPVFRAGRFRREPVEGLGAGSGVVVSENGLILTNAHVVDESREAQVQLLGGREVVARVISIDPASDLALLKTPDTDLHPITFAEDPPPRSGAEAYLAGNPGDVGLQVTWARLGVHRRVRVGARPIEFWCEIQAPVGPGDSGGALFDADGRLLGIPGLQIAYAGERPAAPAVQAGLFIPASHVLRSLEKMKEGPQAEWPWIGLLLEDPLLRASEGKTWSDTAPPRVRRVFPGSPAAAAGFRPGDRILEIGGRAVQDNFDALDAVLDLDPGEAVTVALERDGRHLELGVTPALRPPDPRPDPIDDFALHTGLRLEVRSDPRRGRATILLAGLMDPATSAAPPVENGFFAQDLVLGSLVPGQELLEGGTRPVRVASADDLSSLLPRCFVKDQFVALAHWSRPGSGTLDRAHVHRKIYPVVL